METTKKSTRKTARKISAEKIQETYINALLMNGRRPASVYKFCIDAGMKEDDFYSVAGSFEGLERIIWNSFIETTIARLKADKTFSTFTGREKMLAFYYTLLEELKANRSFILLSLHGISKLEIIPDFLKSFKATFEQFVNEILTGGKESGEVANRPFIDKSYPHLFWLHISFILLFWTKDNSPSFEQTDAAVEKSVNLAFDLISKGAVDSALDFAKFLYQFNSK
jgi:hypothetical protein